LSLRESPVSLPFSNPGPSSSFLFSAFLARSKSKKEKKIVFADPGWSGLSPRRMRVRDRKQAVRQSARQEAEVAARGKMRANKSCQSGIRERLCQYIYLYCLKLLNLFFKIELQPLITVNFVS
jgi:hypothetical protein